MYFSGTTACNRSFTDCTGYGLYHTPVENLRKDPVFLWPFDITGKCMSGGNLHLIRDPCCTDIESPAEDPRKCKGIIDLVGKITAPGSDNCCPGQRASSGNISGMGFARAKMMGSLFIDRTIAGVMIAGTDTPIQTSAPCIASSSVSGPPGFVGLFGDDELVLVCIQSLAVPVDDTLCCHIR